MLVIGEDVGCRTGAVSSRADARPLGPLPTRAGWRFEPKLDGYRCLVCTHGRFRARSCRGWDMTALLPEIGEALPPNLQLDGELVALDDEGHPDFHRLGRRMLHRQAGVAVSTSRSTCSPSTPRRRPGRRNARGARCSNR